MLLFNTAFLDDIIRAKQMSESEIARRLGVSRQIVNNWRIIRNRPKIDHILKICNVFDVAPSMFFINATITEKDFCYAATVFVVKRLCTKAETECNEALAASGITRATPEVKLVRNAANELMNRLWKKSVPDEDDIIRDAVAASIIDNNLSKFGNEDVAMIRIIEAIEAPDTDKETNQLCKKAVTAWENIIENHISTKKTRPKPKFLKTSREIRLAEHLLTRIRENKPDFRQPNMQSWAGDIDLILRIDKRQPLEVHEIINFASRNDFWSRNILSPKKLRFHFDRLVMETQAKSNNNQANARARAAGEAWSNLLESAKNATDGFFEINDNLAKAIVKSWGGTQSILMADQRKLGFLRKDFLKKYGS
jgi:transcriptional regulator with XRE-family HTH domain